MDAVDFHHTAAPPRASRRLRWIPPTGWSAAAETFRTPVSTRFVRLGRSGAPDRSFGSGGVITAPAEIDFIGGDLVAGAHALGIAGRGEIVATGRYQFGASGYAALWAITARGRLDQRAAPGGPVKNQLPSDLGGELTSIAVAADGSVYAGGDMQSFNRPTVGLVARYRGLPSR